MTMPGFTAEAAVAKTQNRYRGGGVPISAPSTQLVSPQSVYCHALGAIYGIIHPILGLVAWGLCLALE
jgi:hypothetical protein